MAWAVSRDSRAINRILESNPIIGKYVTWANTANDFDFWSVAELVELWKR